MVQDARRCCASSPNPRRVEASSETILDTTTKRTYVNISKPGQYIAYRVSPKRNSVTSLASTPVVLWDTIEPVELQIAA